MFDKFGEMSSYKEIDTLAENLFNEGDLKNLKEMAKENGIPEDFVELYLSGDIMELCDAETAAYGKIDVEVKELKLKGIMEEAADTEEAVKTGRLSDTMSVELFIVKYSAPKK